MTEGGEFGDHDPLITHDDKDEGNTTAPFKSWGSSTPAPSGEGNTVTTMSRRPERGSRTKETSFIEGNFDPSLIRKDIAWDSLKEKFPNATQADIEAQYSATSKLEVRISRIGKKYYQLFTKDRATGEDRLNPKLPKEIKKALGSERETLIQQKDSEITELDQNLREDQVVANDENETPAIRERAQEKIQEKIAQRGKLVNERERLQEGLSLKDKVKAIFKKYGLTVTAVLLAVGTTVGVIVSALSKGLATVTNGVGNGLKELGKKIGSILPGLLGAVVSFVFGAAGQVISFLGKNAWLLILAVAAFLIERVSKRR